MRWHPALVLLTGGCLAAIAGEHYETMLALLTKPKVIARHSGREEPPVKVLSPYWVWNGDLFNQAVGQRWHAPLSEHFFRMLREPFRELLPDDRAYDRCFDRFEYCRSLLEADCGGGVRSVGRYGWKWRDPHADIMKQIEEEEQQYGTKWAPYQAGWFQGQRDRFIKAAALVRDRVNQLGWRW